MGAGYIVASGSNGSHNWYYNDSSSNFGNGSSARCTAPASSGTGTLNFNTNNDGNNNSNNNYYVDRGGACASWTIVMTISEKAQGTCLSKPPWFVSGCLFKKANK